jgi:uncharacterized 2Fe-2S/4Fe-4S cluster protein (DUF4445 family)
MGDETARVRFEPAGREVTVPLGTTLLEAAYHAGVDIPAPCGGVGRCGACRVLAEGRLSPATRDEQDVLGGAGVAAGKRLACRARLTGEATVTLGRPPGEARVVTTSVSLTASAASRVSADLLAAAVDVGTTTLAVALVDPASGDVIAEAGALNPQATFGGDVMARMTAALAGHGAELQRSVVAEVESMLLGTLAEVGARREALSTIVCCGNTTMTSLLLGVDVAPLAEAPYEGAHTAETRVTGSSIGFEALGSAETDVLPAASAFIGSDVVAGLIATGLAERTRPALMIDLGTNGEIVLAADGELLAASAAAGPALEGAAISCGMRAETGAIERVGFSGDDLVLGTIGEAPPVGICGSGLLDLVAVLLDAGVLDSSGRLRSDAAVGALADRVEDREGGRMLVIDRAADIVLTQQDVRQVQLAVAAVRTGIELVLAEAGMAPDDVGEVVVAGGFGLHVDPGAIERVGLVPRGWRERVIFVGNAALAGACRVLADDATWEAARGLAARIRTIDLAAHPGFQARFISALNFPE